ncbi:MAG: DUF192 domain-containing protein [Nanoarchaeota archaeon]|nr:DUF192 domain-containing protein [Nanoarchaeota archaeon]MBU1028442.1 DUF192 domain-containing protein [Nanoarchaeota archaeon]
MKRKISFKYKGKKINLDTEICRGARMGMGLMFKSRKTDALLFEFSKPNKMSLTALFVFFPFIAVFIDDKNKVMEVRRIKPFKFLIKPKKTFTKLIEIPINDKYHKQIELLDDS